MSIESLRHCVLGTLFALIASACTTAAVKPNDTVITPKVVIVTMFERGEDSGDAPGEFQFWNERRELNTVFPFHGHHDIHYNEDSGILAVVTGVGTAKAAASIMGVGMDPRFDLSKSYWLVAGIAGFDPEDASLASAAWAEYLVDGDLAHEIDSREKPDDWEWGYIARHTKVPFDPNRPTPKGEIFKLNGDLTDWAFELTRDIELPDSPGLREARALYTEHPNAQRPPFVLRGDHLAALTFWHGEILNGWANAWVDYWSDGKGEFVSSAMEETGTFQSLTYLHRIGKVDKNRVMVLRTASNYTMPPPGISAADNLLNENDGYSGLVASLESAYLVGSVVVDEILSDWPRFANELPEARSTKKTEVTNMTTPDYPYIYHLIQADLWEQATSTNTFYYPPTYEQDGFTHGTANPDMLLNVANHFYTDVPGDWLCLKMTVESITQSGVEVVFEGTAPVGDTQPNFEGSKDELYPHILGGIRAEAVLEITTVTRAPDGRFLDTGILR